MNKYITLALCIVLLAFTRVSYADVITNDPNSQPKEAVINEQPTNNLDPRLAQKVTYQSTGQRLHTVCDELTNQTGVAIRSGSSPKDWQARDIPVVVCVKDLPLSKVLESLAAATHLALTASKDDKGVISYRIFMDIKRKAQLEDYDTKVDEYKLATAKYQWDVACRLGSLPASMLEERKYVDSKFPNLYDFSIPMWRIIASFGSDGWQRLVAGEKLRVTTEDPKAGRFVGDIKRIFREELEDQEAETAAQYPGHSSHFPFLDDDKTCFDISLSASGFSGLCLSIVTKYGIRSEGCPITHADKYIKDLPAQPSYPEPLKTSYPASFRDIKYPGDDSAILQAKINLSKPQGKEKIKFSDALCALANGCDYSIIAVDFMSYQEINYDTWTELMGKETTLAEAIKGVSYYGNTKWLVDETNKVFIGTEQLLCGRYKNMVPEDLYLYAKQKMDTDGLEIDDFLVYTQLTDGQKSAWFGTLDNIRNPFGAYCGAIDDNRTIPWNLYASLSPENKRLARSETGLPLAKLDLNYVASVFTRIVRPDDWNVREDLRNWCGPGMNWHPDLPTNPEDIGKLVMRLEEEKSNDDPKRHRYKIVIKGEECQFEVPWVWWMDNKYFPLYSQKREKELTQQKQQTPGVLQAGN